MKHRPMTLVERLILVADHLGSEGWYVKQKIVEEAIIRLMELEDEEGEGKAADHAGGQERRRSRPYDA